MIRLCLGAAASAYVHCEAERISFWNQPTSRLPDAGSDCVGEPIRLGLPTVLTVARGSRTQA